MQQLCRVELLSHDEEKGNKKSGYSRRNSSRQSILKLSYFFSGGCATAGGETV